MKRAVAGCLEQGVTRAEFTFPDYRLSSVQDFVLGALQQPPADRSFRYQTSSGTVADTELISSQQRQQRRFS